MDKLLKDLEIAQCAYQLALNYDYVPEFSEETQKYSHVDIFDEIYSLILLKESMIKFEGWSDGDMTNEVMSIGEELIKLNK